MLTSSVAACRALVAPDSPATTGFGSIPLRPFAPATNGCMDQRQGTTTETERYYLCMRASDTSGHGPRYSVRTPSPPLARDTTAAVARYQVLDVDRAIAFYTEHLGFHLEQRAGAVFVTVSRGQLHLLLSGSGSSGWVSTLKAAAPAFETKLRLAQGSLFAL